MQVMERENSRNASYRNVPARQHAQQLDLSDIAGCHTGRLQPNSGAKGEYTGLLTIQKYHNSRVET